MSGSSVPSGEFRWVPSDGAPRSPRGRRWWLITAVTVVVAALVVGGVVAWRFRHRESAQAAAPLIGAPKDMLIPFSLLRLPVAGWRVSTADLGLPRTALIGAAFASNGDKAYFATSDCGSDCHRPRSRHDGEATGSMYGLDLRTGARLFGPISLPGFDTEGGHCHSNGPSLAVCLGYDNALNLSSWVVDLDRGALIYSGPTDLARKPLPFDYGESGGVSRLLHALEGKGIYGIGPDAKHSWFVAGSGILTGIDSQEDVPPLTIAAQIGGHGQPDRVFSVVDGTDLTPTPPPGLTLGDVVIYHGGFAYPWTESATSGGVLFYDTAGKLVKKTTSRPVRTVDNAAMPTVNDQDNRAWEIYTAAGDIAIRFKASDSVGDFRTIGTTVLQRDGASLNTEDRKPWQQWDLATGNRAGPDCKFDTVGYQGSDGRVIVTDGGEDYHQVAIDLATCKTVWELPANLRLWRVGRSLLQYGADGNSVTSMRAAD